jgi:ABC-type phosphate transport system auxiliary subunit
MLLDAYLFRGVRYVYAATPEMRRQRIQTRIKITKLKLDTAKLQLTIATKSKAKASINRRIVRLNTLLQVLAIQLQGLRRQRERRTHPRPKGPVRTPVARP